MLWEPETPWQGQDAFIIGGGASLRSFDFNLLKGRNTIGCNDAFRLGEEVVKICLFGDASWFHRTAFALDKFKNPIFNVAPSLLSLQTPMLTHLIRKGKGLHEGNAIGWNFSTGASAVNLAINMGATRVFLLGIDLMLIDGRSHWHEHRHHKTREMIFGRFLKGFSAIADSLRLPKYQDVQVIHICHGSSPMPFFLKMSFEELHQVLHIPASKEEVFA